MRQAKMYCVSTATTMKEEETVEISKVKRIDVVIQLRKYLVLCLLLNRFHLKNIIDTKLLGELGWLPKKYHEHDKILILIQQTISRHGSAIV